MGKNKKMKHTNKDRNDERKKIKNKMDVVDIWMKQG
jgi:hypothetical protein